MKSKVHNVLGVKFLNNDKTYWFNNSLSNLEIGEQVIVDTKNGDMIAEIVEFNDKSNFKEGSPTKNVISKYISIDENKYLIPD